MAVIIPNLNRRQTTVLIAGLAQTLRALAKEHKKILDHLDPQAYQDLIEKIMSQIRSGALSNLEVEEETLILNALYDLSLEALTLR